VFVTFHLVCLAWISFRADSLADAARVASRGVMGMPGSISRLAGGASLDALVYLGQGRSRFVFAVSMIAAGTLLRSYFRGLGVTDDSARVEALASPWVRAIVYALMVYLIAFHGTATQGFMYEQY
jgi:hypothetical protein